MRINFDVEMQVEQRTEDLYAATINPFHITAYADSPDGAIDRVKEGVVELLANYEPEGNVTRFLDETDVRYEIEEEPRAQPALTTPRHVKSVWETMEYAGVH